MKNRHRAFTLIELLIVISIIALLLAIVVPTLNKVKLKARRVICMNNIRSILLATVLYSNDNKGNTPPGDMWNGFTILHPPPGICNAGHLLEGRYLPEPTGKKNVFYCPDMEKYKEYLLGTFESEWGKRHSGSFRPIDTSYFYRASMDGCGPYAPGAQKGVLINNIAKYPLYTDIPHSHLLVVRDGVNVGFGDTHVDTINEKTGNGKLIIDAVGTSATWWDTWIFMYYDDYFGLSRWDHRRFNSQPIHMNGREPDVSQEPRLW